METSDSSRRTFYRFRVEMLERLVRLEDAMDAAIAASFARSATACVELRVEIVSTMPLQRRIKALKGVMERHDLARAYPFVVPILNEVVEVRNSMAHGLDDESANPGDGTIRMLGISSGRVTSVSYNNDYLDWLFAQARQVQRELELMYWQVAPEDPDWHES